MKSFNEWEIPWKCVRFLQGQNGSESTVNPLTPKKQKVKTKKHSVQVAKGPTV